ncbi:MAG: hypothetical protein PUE13_05770 [Clostridiales bacterium]|nr:hypothetical protein [Clostridiales bacterium]
MNYLIESTDHSIKNGVHYVKIGHENSDNISMDKWMLLWYNK